ncbi:MAG: immunoglobulin-like domain-containing protein [bacterium]
MTSTALDVRKFVTILLIFAITCAAIPASVFAAPTVTAGGNVSTSSSTLTTGQAGISLGSIVQDSVGAVAAAAIACNKTKIQNGIRNLLVPAAEDTAKQAAATAAAAAAKEAGGSGAPADQLVHLSSTDKTNQALQNIATNTEAQVTKTTCTNAMEKAAAGVILRQLTLATVNWINHGFNGSPLYSTNTGAILKNLGDKALRDFNATFAFDNKNYPFGRDFVLHLAKELQTGFEKSSKYSLNAVIAQRYPGLTDKDFAVNFTNGGWSAFNSQFDIGNDPLGFRMSATQEITKRLAQTAYSPMQDIKDTLQRSGGFLDIKTCVDPKYNPDADTDSSKAADAAAADAADAANKADALAADALAAAQKSGDAAAIKSAQAALDIADNQSAAASAALLAADNAYAAVNASKVCNQWKVQTPGSVVANALTQTINIPSNQLINGQDLSTDITAIFNALANQLINKGLSSLSNSTNAQSNSNFTKNNPGVPITTSVTVNNGVTANGTWANAGTNFNVFTDIPSVIRYEYNQTDTSSSVPGCTTPDQEYNNAGDPCVGDLSLPEGYQQILAKEIAAQHSLITNIYSLDYCIPGPHPGWQNEIETNAQNFVANPALFLASASQSDLKKVLTTYGQSAGSVIGLTVGVVATSVALGAGVGTATAPVIGTAIGAVVGLVVGAILHAIGTDTNREAESIYGPFMNAIMGVEFEQNGDGRADLNGHDHSSRIVTTLASRYKKAMLMTYAPTYRDTVISQDISDHEFPKDGSKPTVPYTPTTYDVGATPKTISDIPDLSTSSYTRAKIENGGYQGFNNDIPDLVAADTAEFANIQSDRDSMSQNQVLKDTSATTVAQLYHLLLRVRDLPNEKGFPGVNGKLDLIPTINLLGNQTMSIAVGTKFVDPGATANDPYKDGNITNSIVTIQNVDTTTPGIYTVTYDVKNSAGISASQVTRTVQVLDPAGNTLPTIPNYAVSEKINTSLNNAILSVNGVATQSNSTTTQTNGVRDYNADLQVLKGLSSQSGLSDYEAEILRISNSFQQIAPYIHGPDDLKQEEAVFDQISNKNFAIGSIKDPDGTIDGMRKSATGMLADCIKRTAVAPDGTVPRFITDGGPTNRVAFSFYTSNDGTIENLPQALLKVLPPQQSFLPDWHYAQGNGIKLFGKNPFPNDGEQDYPADQKNQAFFFANFWGGPMVDAPGFSGPSESVGSVKLDYNKLIRNHDVSTINIQPINNALVGLEHIIGIY